MAPPSGGGFFAGRHGVIADAALPPRSRGRSAVATATVRYPIPRDLPARRRDILAGISAAGRTCLGGLAPNEFAARSQQDHNPNGFWL